MIDYDESGLVVSKMVVYQQLFWLFMVGNVAGVIVEGLWCKVRYGKWQTHVVALWGPFNIVYGIGIAMFYVGTELLLEWAWFIRIAALALIGSLVEYLCGLIIRIGLHMKAWDYRKHFLNIQGLISLKMTLVWGTLGFVFDHFLYQPLKKILSEMTGIFWDIACAGMSAFIMVDFICTAVCIIRWANRHQGKPPLNWVSEYIDRKFPDSWMASKFCNWKFDENAQVNGCEPAKAA